MTQYGTVTNGVGIVKFIESADPQDLQTQVNAYLVALAALEAPQIVSAITLAGAGDGHTFVVLVESALTANVGGGITPAGTAIRCYLAGSDEGLAAARTLAVNPVPVFDTQTLGIIDEQLAGGAKGQRFMGMAVFSDTIPGNLSVPTALVAYPSQALTSTSTILTGMTAFSSPDMNQFAIVAPGNVLQYTGALPFGVVVDASVTVELAAPGVATVAILQDPLVGANVIGSSTTTVPATPPADNVGVLALAVMLPIALLAANSKLGIRVTSGNGTMLGASMRVTPL